MTMSGTARGIFASTDAMVGAIAFSAFFLVFVLNTSLAQGSASTAISNEARYLAAGARLQHSIFLIGRLGMNTSDAEFQLDYDVGASNYSIVPFASSYKLNGSLARMVVIGNNVYYIEVHPYGS